MKFKDINARFTQTVAAYLAKGYTFNTSTMGGSQGEIAKVDLTDGTEIIRVCLDTYHNYGGLGLDGVSLVVARSTDDIAPNSGDQHQTLWTSHAEVLSTETFYTVGDSYRAREKFYCESEEQATAAKRLHYDRYRARQTSRAAEEDITDKHLELAKSIAKTRLGATRIRRSDIRLVKQTKKDGGTAYIVRYCQKSYMLK